MSKNKYSFKHSGDLGDIIFSLPVIKEFGGGVLYLDPTGGEQDNYVNWAQYTSTKFNENTAKQLKPILEAQPYIDEVIIDTGKEARFNLNKFRQFIKHNNLTASHLEAFKMLGRSSNHDTEPWLDWPALDLPEGKRNIIARSCRYHSNYTFWECLEDQVIDDSVFMGLEKEFEYFLYTFPRYKGRIERLDTPNLSDVVGYIAGCGMFLGNQGFPHAVAEAMKKDMVNEVYRLYPAALFKRPNVKYV